MRSTRQYLVAPVPAGLCSACGPTIAVFNPTLVGGVDRSRGKRIASDTVRLTTASLGVGRYTVDTLVDGRVGATSLHHHRLTMESAPPPDGLIIEAADEVRTWHCGAARCSMCRCGRRHRPLSGRQRQAARGP